MSSLEYHYAQAEALLAEGVDVVHRISELDDQRAAFNTAGESGRFGYRIVTAHMDELGKKAMGIWAQAQVHATLATAADSAAAAAEYHRQDI